MQIYRLRILFTLLVLSIVSSANGQVVSQSIELNQGWNFIWLQVNPMPNDPATVLNGLDYNQISTFMPGTTDNPDGSWVTFYPNLPAGISNTFPIMGEHGYLINMNTAGSLNVSGMPANGSKRFTSNTSQLFGLILQENQNISFNQYFGFGSANNKIANIIQLTEDGFVPVGADDNIVSGASYWINFTSGFTYNGPFRVLIPEDGYKFEDRGYIDNVVIEVPVRNQAQVITIRTSSPQGQTMSDTGTVIQTAGNGDSTWLEYLTINERPGGLHERTWSPFTTDGVQFTIPANTSRYSLTIRANRQSRGVANLLQSPPQQYQALLNVMNEDGYSISIPASMEVAPYNGLYVGQAILDQVSEATNVKSLPINTPADPSYVMPDPVLAPAANMPISLILELPDPTLEPDRPMRLLDQKTLHFFREGREIRYRYNAVLFTGPVTLEGSVENNGLSGSLSGTTTIAEDSPLNPYRHRYHPEHRTGYEITRQITLEFTPDDTNPATQAFGLAESAANNELHGVYTETITGLSLYPVTVRGTFKLRRLSRQTDFSMGQSN